MARRRDTVMEELRQIRRRLSRRLYLAYKEGRLEDEVARLEREGRKTRKEVVDGSRNGRSKPKPRAKKKRKR